MQHHADSAMGDSTAAAAAAAASSSAAAGESIAAAAASSSPQIDSLERVLRLNADYQSFLHSQLGELQLLLQSNAEKRRLVEQIQTRSDAQHKHQAVVTRRAIFEAPFFVDQNGNVRKRAQRSAGQPNAGATRQLCSHHATQRLICHALMVSYVCRLRPTMRTPFASDSCGAADRSCTNSSLVRQAQTTVQLGGAEQPHHHDDDTDMRLPIPLCVC